MKPQSPVFSTSLRLLCLAVLGGLAAFAIPLPPSHAAPRLLEQIVAIVNNEIILHSEWLQRFEAIKPQLEQIVDTDERERKAKTLKWDVLQAMVDDKLLEQKARTLQISVTDAEVDALMKQTRERYKLSESDFAEELKKQGYSLESYKVMIRKELGKHQLMGRELRQKIRIAKEDERAFYNKMISSVQAGPPEYHLRHIVFLLPEKPEAKQIDEQRRQAENVLLLAKQQPSKFAEIAKRFSQDSNKDQGGDLGFLKPGDVHPAIEKAMTQMKQGQVWDRVIQTPMGFHLLFLEKFRASDVLSFEEARPKIQAQLQQEAFTKARLKYLEDLRKVAVIEILVDKEGNRKPSEEGQTIGSGERKPEARPTPKASPTKGRSPRGRSPFRGSP